MTWHASCRVAGLRDFGAFGRIDAQMTVGKIGTLARRMKLCTKISILIVVFEKKIMLNKRIRNWHYEFASFYFNVNLYKNQI